MSNLIRGPQDFLLNSLTGVDLGMYVNSAGVKVLVFKKLGIEIPASTGTKAVIAEAITGNLQKLKIQLDWLWNGEKEHVFELFVTKQPLVDGNTHHQFAVGPHTYQFKMTAFTTVDAGTLNDDDKDTIINGLIAAVSAHHQVTPNAINSGRAVNAAQYQAGSPLADVHGSMTLEAVDGETIFTVVTDPDFSQTEITPFRKSTLTYDQLVQLFGIRAQREGAYPTAMPVSGTTYMKVIITQVTEGYDNVIPSGVGTRKQVYNFYLPASYKSANAFATVTDATTNTNSMADTVGSKTKSFKDYLVYLCGSANVIDN